MCIYTNIHVYVVRVHQHMNTNLVAHMYLYDWICRSWRADEIHNSVHTLQKRHTQSHLFTRYWSIVVVSLPDSHTSLPEWVLLVGIDVVTLTAKWSRSCSSQANVHTTATHAISYICLMLLPYCMYPTHWHTHTQRHTQKIHTLKYTHTHSHKRYTHPNTHKRTDLPIHKRYTLIHTRTHIHKRYTYLHLNTHTQKTHTFNTHTYI